MNQTRRLGGKLGLVLCGALFGCAAYGQPSVSVGVSVTLPTVQIRTAGDFYEPLASDGQWIVVGSYGRVWRPAHVARGWRPYCDGNWVWTEDGWYWVSDEPWAWATYHYGRWDYTDEYGWYWVPQTQWAPAWVSWHQGGGYIGWTPMYPPGVTISSTRAFVGVKQARFLDRIRPTTVIVNSDTIIRRTSVLSHTRMVNKTRFNEGPSAAFVEKATKRQLTAVPVQELRQKQEAPVRARQQTRPPPGEKTVPPPDGNEVRARNDQPVNSHGSSPAPKSAPVRPEPAGPGPENHAAPDGKHQSAPVAPKFKPGHDHPSAAPPKAGNHGGQPGNPPANTSNGSNPPDHGNGNRHQD